MTAAANGLVRVFIADDHPLYRTALSHLLRERPELEVVGQAADAEQALAGILDVRPDVALLDVKMPGDGVSVSRALRDLGLDTPVLFLSGYTEAEDVYRAVSAGASGYLAKEVGGDVICDALLAVARGETGFCSATEASLVDAVHQHGETARVRLSDRERQILQAVAGGRSNAEIGQQLHISSETVKTHLRSAFEKLGVKDRTAAVAQALRQALIS